jgi:hypothetical protein
VECTNPPKEGQLAQFKDKAKHERKESYHKDCPSDCEVCFVWRARTTLQKLGINKAKMTSDEYDLFFEVKLPLMKALNTEYQEVHWLQPT